MPNYIDGLIQNRERRTLENLDSILSLLGSTRTVLFPLLEPEGINLESYGETSENLVPTEILGDGFQPVRHQGGINSYFFQRLADAHLAGNDVAVYSGISGGTDAPFSVGAWCLPTLTGTQQTILSKYDAAGTAREWQLFLNASEIAVMEYFDESLADGVTATWTTALSVQQWAFVVVTYDGAGGAPSSSGMSLAVYLNGVDDSATIADTGGNVYVDMEDLAAPFLVGASGVTATPTFEFEGRIALPFVCGKQLSANEVSQLYGIGRRLLGLT